MHTYIHALKRSYVFNLQAYKPITAHTYVNKPFGLHASSHANFIIYVQRHLHTFILHTYIHPIIYTYRRTYIQTYMHT